MDDHLGRPDITLTLDSDGVIRDVASSEALADEDLRDWRGRAWEQTVAREAGLRVSRLIETSRSGGEFASIQVNQTLPSGRETPIEYTMISLGEKAGFVAIGRDMQAMADLQSRLADAQQARERDYWKLRDVETRYRALMDASSDAVVLVRAANLRVVEANVAAAKALRLVPGAECFSDLSPRDRKALDAMLAAVRAQGRAPSIALHLGVLSQWSLRASLIAVDGGAFYLFQMTSLAGSAPAFSADPLPVEAILQRLPEAFVVVDREGVVRRANDMFLDLVQVGVEPAAIGQPLTRWLFQPGADASMMLALLNRHGSLRNLASRIEGDLGSGVDVEISAVGDLDGGAEFFGLLLREATSRDAPQRLERAALASSPPAGPALPEASLEDILRASTEAIERRSIAEAIGKSRGNRTMAAKYLGLSRQSLHAKLRKYGPGLA